MKLIIAAVCAVVLAVGSVLYVDHRDNVAAKERDYGPCGVVVVREATDRLDDLARQLDDAEELASHTPRMSLAVPLKGLQDLAHDVRRADVPACLGPARFLLETRADLSVESSMAFAAERPREEVVGTMATAQRYRGFYNDAVAQIKACAPACPANPWDPDREANVLRSWKLRDQNAAYSAR